MRAYLIFNYLLVATFAAKLDLDPLDNLNEEQFEEEFHLEPVEDPEEKLRREEALVENENLIKETNQEYLNGEISWWDEVNEFADLPEVNLCLLSSSAPYSRYIIWTSWSALHRSYVSEILQIFLGCNHEVEKGTDTLKLVMKHP